MMRAFIMEGFGEPHQAVVGELPLPEIGPDDLLVRIRAAALNPVDWKEMAGLLASFYPPYPARWVPGFDGSGVVEAVGSEVREFSPGDHVLVRPDRTAGHGTLAQYAKVPQGRAAKAPPNLSHAETATLATAGRTAYQALLREDIGVLTAGQSLLIDGASGGVGGFTVALAHALGGSAAGTCRCANAEYVRGLGADLVLDYGRPDLVDEVRRWRPGGVDVVVDTNSGGSKPEWLDVLAPGGRLIVLATLTNDAGIRDLIANAEARSLSIHFLLLDYTALQRDILAITRMFERSRMRMPQINIYPLNAAAEAMQAVKSGGMVGKIVVEISDN